MFCMFPGSKSEWKKGATGQSFIRKKITSYRIGTLVTILKTLFTTTNAMQLASSCTPPHFTAYEELMLPTSSPKFASYNLRNAFVENKKKCGGQFSMHLCVVFVHKPATKHMFCLQIHIKVWIF